MGETLLATNPLFFSLAVHLISPSKNLSARPLTSLPLPSLSAQTSVSSAVLVFITESSMPVPQPHGLGYASAMFSSVGSSFQAFEVSSYTNS